jgi:hypothetical protein
VHIECYRTLRLTGRAGAAIAAPDEIIAAQEGRTVKRKKDIFDTVYEVHQPLSCPGKVVGSGAGHDDRVQLLRDLRCVIEITGYGK